jgi:N-acetylglutamate synthase-like GNAT family acetyltransferase
MMYLVKTNPTPAIIEQIIDLRYEVLRKPWNQTRQSVTDDLEEIAVNAYIEKDGEIIACGRLQNNGNGIGQIRYMAVENAFQGKGLGKLIVTKLEDEAKRLRLNTIELQARENALEFYKNQDYIIKETSFKLWDIIQHYLMTKHL